MPGGDIPKSIVKAWVDSARILDSQGLSLDPESTKSFLAFNSAIVGKELDEKMAYSLVTCVVTTTDGVQRTFTLDADLTPGGPIEVKSYQCFMKDGPAIV